MNIYLTRPTPLNIVLFFLLLVEIFLLWPQVSFSEPNHSLPQISVIPTMTPSPTPIPFYPPHRLAIPKIQVDTTVEQVGVGDDGTLLVSSIPENVGWYRMGSMPGETGTAVIVGHLDLANGAPAIFYNLRALEVGDEIFVTDQKGKQMKFVVTSKISYPMNEIPVQEIFHGEGKPILNLITCDGAYIPGFGYTNRIVISAERKN